MNCREVQEQISAAVDNRLESNFRREFTEHIEACSLCRSDFELERLTKGVIQRHVKRSTTPSALHGSILAQLGAVGQAEPSRTTRVWSFLRLRPALAAAALAVLAIVLFVSLPLKIRHLHSQPSDNNIVHQSFNNFDAVIDGTLAPEMTSSDPSQVQAYFASHVNYKVKVPKKISKCELAGGLVSTSDGKPLAHVMYKHGDDVVYLYQVDMATVLESKALMLPENVKEELIRTGWYVESPHPNCSLVMWVVDNTLCTAVADMDKNELMAYLSYSE